MSVISGSHVMYKLFTGNVLIYVKIVDKCVILRS